MLVYDLQKKLPEFFIEVRLFNYFRGLFTTFCTIVSYTCSPAKLPGSAKSTLKVLVFVSRTL